MAYASSLTASDHRRDGWKSLLSLFPLPPPPSFLPPLPHVILFFLPLEALLLLLLFQDFLWTFQVTDYCKISGLGNCLPRTCRGRWKGGRWRGKCQLERCMDQRCGAKARTHQKDILAHWFVDITEFFPDTTMFYDNKTCTVR